MRGNNCHYEVISFTPLPDRENSRPLGREKNFLMSKASLEILERGSLVTALKVR